MAATLKLFSVALLPALAAAQETVVGVYMFHRHGDRTAKAWPPTNLTDLGYAEVYASGGYYRSRYLEANSTQYIQGINTDIVLQSQISASSPADTVIQNSAEGFLQGFYPPTGETPGSELLANGSRVDSPLNGYQLIPISIIASDAGSEDTGFLQSASSCANAIYSADDYFYTAEYEALYNSTMAFYQSFESTINTTYNSTQDTFYNAYLIFDLINVARIHNSSFDPQGIITDDVFQQIGNLANIHEYNLAYNASSTVRAIAGAQLAAEALDFLNGTITSAGSSKFGIQFGAYGTFTSFFGLAGLPSSLDGIADYASSMALELYTTSNDTSGFPAVDDLSVRMLFHNGTASTSSPPTLYPMFGSAALNMSWTDFSAAMTNISISTTAQWCTACGNTTGLCALTTTSSGGQSSGDGTSSSGSHLSLVDAGVIGAFVTVGFFLIVAALVFLVGGLTLVSRRRLRQGRAAANGAPAGLKA